MMRWIRRFRTWAADIACRWPLATVFAALFLCWAAALAMRN